MTKAIKNAVLRAVAAHDGQLSPNLFRAFLVGHECGLFTEKGLTQSLYFGCLRHKTEAKVGEAIEVLIREGRVGVNPTWHGELVMLK